MLTRKACGKGGFASKTAKKTRAPYLWELGPDGVVNYGAGRGRLVDGHAGDGEMVHDLVVNGQVVHAQVVHGQVAHCNLACGPVTAPAPNPVAPAPATAAVGGMPPQRRDPEDRDTVVKLTIEKLVVILGTRA